MTASIFLRTFRGDRFFAEYLLKSLAKFAEGFREIVVVIPEIDRLHFDGFNFCNATVKWIDEPDNGRGYTEQQITKMHADEFCAGDTIMVVDSDTFLKERITPEMFMLGGKPISLIRHWQEAGSAIAWKPITERFLTYEMIFEGMCALPVCIDRRSLPLFRDYALATHSMTIDEYVRQCQNNEFSEFNAMSAFAHRFCPYMYSWNIANPETDGFPRSFVQRWSHIEGGIENYRAEYEKILASEPAFAIQEP